MTFLLSRARLVLGVWAYFDFWAFKTISSYWAEPIISFLWARSVFDILDGTRIFNDPEFIFGSNFSSWAFGPVSTFDVVLVHTYFSLGPYEL